MGFVSKKEITVIFIYPFINISLRQDPRQQIKKTKPLQVWNYTSKTRFDDKFSCIIHDINVPSIALWSTKPIRRSISSGIAIRWRTRPFTRWQGWWGIFAWSRLMRSPMPLMTPKPWYVAMTILHMFTHFMSYDHGGCGVSHDFYNLSLISNFDINLLSSSFTWE